MTLELPACPYVGVGVTRTARPHGAMKRLGLIVNPIAGMGGRCGLKGTDGAEILARAFALGALPESPCRAGLALSQLAPLRGSIEILTVSGDMGETEALQAGFQPTVLFATNNLATTSEDTRACRARDGGGWRRSHHVLGWRRYGPDVSCRGW